jgi:hypothetical protein
MRLVFRQSLSLVAVAFCAFALTACLSSDKSLIEADSRVLPFTSPITIDVYGRETPTEPWHKESDRATLVADSQRVVRIQGKSTPTYVFYQLEPGRFLVEGQMESNGRYAYGVLEIRDGEGVMTHLKCENVDLAAFQKAGGVVTGDSFKDCKIDKIFNALAFLRALAIKPTGSQQRYVPVR